MSGEGDGRLEDSDAGPVAASEPGTDPALTAAAAAAVAAAVAGASAATASMEPGATEASRAPRAQASDDEDSESGTSSAKQRPAQFRGNGASRMSHLYGADEAAAEVSKMAASGFNTPTGSTTPPAVASPDGRRPILGGLRGGMGGDDRMAAAAREPVASAAAMGTASEGGLSNGPSRAWDASPQALVPSASNRLASMSDFEGTSGTTSEDHHITVSHLHRRQAEWDRQMEFHDQKQAELLTIQWKLVREQTGTLARELGIVQQQLKELKVENRRTVVEVERSFRENEGKLSEERNARHVLADSIEQRFKKVRSDLDAEVKARTTAFAEVQPKLHALEASIEIRTKDHRNLELEVSRLHKLIEAAMQDIEALKEALDQEAAERRTQEESMLDMLRDLREVVQQESKERVAHHEDHVRNHLAILESERIERHQAHNALKEKVTSLQKDLAPHKEDIPAIKSRLQEFEGIIATKLREATKAFERELIERGAQQVKLERRITELSAVSEKEYAARASQVEEYEQMLKNFRTKMKSTLDAQAEQGRQAREELLHTLTEQLERETAMREAQSATLIDQWGAHKTTFDSRVEALEGSLRTIEQRHRDERNAETQDLEAALQRHSEVVGKQLRDQAELLQAKLTEERASREAQGANLEEHIEFLDRFLQDVRNVFMQTGSRSRQLAVRKTSNSVRESLVMGSSPGSLRPPSPASLPGSARTGVGGSALTGGSSGQQDRKSVV